MGCFPLGQCHQRKCPPELRIAPGIAVRLPVIPRQRGGSSRRRGFEIDYTGAPPPPPAGALRPQLQFEILAKRQAETSFNPLPDGDTLASEVDDYLVVVRPMSAGYLYLFQVDSSGKKEWLFPQNSSSPFSSGTNPVA
ncbi:MAG: hypothetical protein HY674_18025, partial [Chloroflexi bacterium]|nr:hypothetical protein [Chloroflexota bacterium]